MYVCHLETIVYVKCYMLWWVKIIANVQTCAWSFATVSCTIISTNLYLFPATFVHETPYNPNPSASQASLFNGSHCGPKLYKQPDHPQSELLMECKRAPTRGEQHHSENSDITRILSKLGQTGLRRTDGNCPDECRKQSNRSAASIHPLGIHPSFCSHCVTIETFGQRGPFRMIISYT